MSDWVIDQAWDRYTAMEHGTWKTLFERQRRLLAGLACQEFLDGMQALPIGPHEIPDFRRLSEVLLKRTGWQVVAVPGLVPDDVFFEHLANRRFPAGNFIRSAQCLDYLEEPDVFHDVFGHVPMLLNPTIADFIQAYGIGAQKALRLGALPMLSRVYWYTVEFGLLQEHGQLRLYGSGIASSFTESRFSLESSSPNRIMFDLERVMRTDYRIDDFQESYFVIPNLDALLELSQLDFAPFYQRAATNTTVEPATVLPQDKLLSRGDRHHHRASMP